MTLGEQLNFTAKHLQGPWEHPKRRSETLKQRHVRIDVITKAIMLELPLAIGGRGEIWFWDDKDLAWATFTKMWFESGRFSLAVHSGKKRGDRGKSVCLGQIMHGDEDLVGTDLASTRRCVATVMKFLIMHQHGCLSEKAKPGPWAMAMIYAGYGTGRTCDANHWMKVHKKGGGYVKNPGGTYKRNYWARKRGYMYWRLRNGKHPAQKVN